MSLEELSITLDNGEVLLTAPLALEKPKDELWVNGVPDGSCIWAFIHSIKHVHLAISNKARVRDAIFAGLALGILFLACWVVYWA